MEKSELKFVLGDLIANAENRIQKLSELKEHLNSLISDTADTELMICYRELRNKVETFIGWDNDELFRLKSEAESIC